MTRVEIDQIFPPNYGGNAQISDLRLALTQFTTSGSYEFTVVGTLAERNTIQANNGDICKVTDENIYVWSNGNWETLDDKIVITTMVEKTVASSTTVDPSLFDFATLHEAFRWVEKTQMASGGQIVLLLDDGLHYLGGVGEFNDSTYSYYNFNYTNLVIEPFTVNSMNCIITLEPNMESYLIGIYPTLINFNFSRIGIMYLTFDLAAGEADVSIFESVTLFDIASCDMWVSNLTFKNHCTSFSLRLSRLVTRNSVVDNVNTFLYQFSSNTDCVNLIFTNVPLFDINYSSVCWSENNSILIISGSINISSVNQINTAFNVKNGSKLILNTSAFSLKNCKYAFNVKTSDFIKINSNAMNIIDCTTGILNTNASRVSLPTAPIFTNVQTPYNIPTNQIQYDGSYVSINTIPLTLKP